MGVYNSKPNVDIDSKTDSNDFIAYSAVSMQGWRKSQEDAHCCDLKLSDENLSALFGVFDGHNGAEVARFCSTEIPKILLQLESFKGKEIDLFSSLINGFMSCDRAVIKPENKNVLKNLCSSADDSIYGSDDDEVCSDNDREEDLSKLIEESRAPIDVIVDKYGGVEALDVDLKKKISEKKDAGCSSKELPSDGKGDEKADSSTDKNAESASADEQKSEKDEEKNESDDETKANVEENNAKDGDKESDQDEDNEDEDSEDESDDDDEETSDSDYSQDEDDPDYKINCPPFTLDPDHEPGFASGCTACVCVLVPDMSTNGIRSFVANAGDSRAVLCRNNTAVDLSFDHKPELDEERNRIENAGGTVNDEGRINDCLNLSRAIGDHNYKKREDLHLSEQMVTAFPNVTDTLLDPDTDKFIVVACDGIWNALTSQEVVDFIQKRLDDPKLVGQCRKNIAEYVQEDRFYGQSNSEKDDESDVEGQTEPKVFDGPLEGEELLKEICEDLFHTCLSPTTKTDGTGCDNMTCVIVLLKDIKAYAKLASVKVGEVKSESDHLIEYQKKYDEKCPVTLKRSSEASEDETAAKKKKLSNGVHKSSDEEICQNGS